MTAVPLDRITSRIVVRRLSCAGIYLIAFVFSLNAIGCGLIASLTAWKRVAFAKHAEKSRPDLGLPAPSAAPTHPFDGGGLLRKAA